MAIRIRRHVHKTRKFEIRVSVRDPDKSNVVLLSAPAGDAEFLPLAKSMSTQYTKRFLKPSEKIECPCLCGHAIELHDEELMSCEECMCGKFTEIVSSS